MKAVFYIGGLGLIGAVGGLIAFLALSLISPLLGWAFVGLIAYKLFSY